MTKLSVTKLCVRARENVVCDQIVCDQVVCDKACLKVGV